MSLSTYRKTPRVLILSSCPIGRGAPAIADQYYEALKRKGIEVDLLLKEPEANRPDIMSVLDKGQKSNFFIKLFNFIKGKLYKQQYPKPNYGFFYRKENEPPLDSKTITNKITKQYDLIYVVFWQTMLSFESIDKIYDKLHCQFQFAGVDYSQMGGGCHFTNGCERYKSGCGCCPAFDSEDKNDFTAWNVQYRKKVYDKVKPIVYGNHYMQEFYSKSILLKNARIELRHSMIIDTDVFKPLPPMPLMIKYGIPLEKKFIVFFACQNLDEDRKGVKYLIEAFNILNKRYPELYKDILVVMAGENYNKIKKLIPYESRGFGYVPMNNLPELFSVSKLFVCPSVNDAGPMMVGQSLCCGTPVVGFDMGAVKDLVKGNNVGICVPLRDSEALAEGMMKVLSMSELEYDKVVKNSRAVALKYCSFDVQADLILKTYYKYIG